jgi:tripartite-type tricarboxylate transporter receptor subunit TctC
MPIRPSRRVLLCALLALSTPAMAEDWPAKAITVVVPLGAGSASDVVARLVMDQVGRQLGQSVVVENRAGAGGTIGAGMVAKSAPDGYTILAYGALATAHALYSKLPYDTLTDLIPVAPIGQQPLAIVVAPSSPYKTLADLIAAAKANPGKLNYSSAGIGSASHFAAERLRMSSGFEAQHITFKGAAEAVTEVVAGRVDFSIQPVVTSLSLIRDKQLVALAVSADKRASLLPDVPTTLEAGLSAESVYPFYTALFVPAKTPAEIVARIQSEATKALQTPTVQSRFATLGVEPMAMTPAQFAAFFKDDVAATVALVKAAKIPTQ